MMVLDDILDGLDRLAAGRPIFEVDEVRWQEIVTGARHFAQAHAERAMALGWRELELFGLHEIKPMIRQDAKGVAFALADATVLEVTAELIRIQTQSGSRGSFGRRQDDRGSVLAWNWKPAKPTYRGPW